MTLLRANRSYRLKGGKTSWDLWSFEKTDLKKRIVKSKTHHLFKKQNAFKVELTLCVLLMLDVLQTKHSGEICLKMKAKFFTVVM